MAAQLYGDHSKCPMFCDFTKGEDAAMLIGWMRAKRWKVTPGEGTTAFVAEHPKRKRPVEFYWYQDRSFLTGDHRARRIMLDFADWRRDPKMARRRTGSM